MRDIFFDEATHTYLVDGAEVVPSVTTILGVITNTEYKGISPTVLEQAAKRGSLVHEYCQLYDYDALPEEDEYGIFGYVKAYADFVRDYRCKWEQIEAPVYSTMGFAGTLDRAGLVEGKQAIVDIKTIANPTKMNKFVVCMQTAAYAIARAETFGTQTLKRYAVYLKDNGDYSVLDCGEYEQKYGVESSKIFCECTNIYYIISILKNAKPIKKGDRDAKV